MDYTISSKIIKDYLELDVSPVGVKFFENEDDANEILNKNEKIMHCQAIITASIGKSFYGTVNEIGCPIGSSILGLKEVPENLINGNKFNKMNVTSTKEVGEKYFSKVPKMNKKISAIGYMPLEDLKIEPDVIVIIGRPIQIFNLIRANTYEHGEQITSSIGGTQSLCGDIVVNCYLTNKPHISFGCIGSHLATELKDDEVVIGFPTSKLNEIVNSIDKVKK